MAPPIRMSNLTIKPSMAWLLVFVPALSYFVATRLQSSGFRWGRSNSLGDRVTSSLKLPTGTSSSTGAQTQSAACQSLSSIFFLATNNACQDATSKRTARADPVEVSLQHGLNLLYQGRGMQTIVASTWRHDEELGRGYLLVSQAHENGRVWRWEVGGGPIAIGRTLHLESSGCRSNHYRPCYPSTTSGDEAQPTLAGSGGIAIDFHQGEGDSYVEGALIVAEWGEGRIIRMEESNGARTPLMVQVPDICHTEDNTTMSAATTRTRRLYQPRSLLYTPYGDLLVSDTAPDCHRAVIYRLSQAVHVESLESLAESRKAHAWNETHHGFPVDVLYQNGIQLIGGMAVDPSWLHMYVTVKDQEGRVLLLQLPIVVEEEDDEEDEEKSDNTETEQAVKPIGLMDHRAQIVMDMTQGLGLSEPGPLVVSEKGHVFTAVPEGVAILSTSKTSNAATILGILPTPQRPTSLTLGEDKFLYSFSDDSMFRIRIREGPVKVPTNLVVGKKADHKAT